MSALRAVSEANVADEQTFHLLMDLHGVSRQQGAEHETDLCADVLEKLVTFFEEEVRESIASKICEADDAPRNVVLFLAVEPIKIAQPILSRSPVLEDMDLITVSQKCGALHLEAIADRSVVSATVTNELMRRGNIGVWERLAANQGAELTDKSVAFLVNRARENPSIQYGLVGRPDLAPTRVKQLLSNADDKMRAHLEAQGRRDLLKYVDKAREVASKRVLSTSSVLGFEFEEAYRKVLTDEKTKPLTAEDLMAAAQRDNFPLVCCIFARLTHFDLEEAVNWLSRREIDPTMVAFKALGFNSNLVQTLLRTGPWKQVLAPHARTRALHTFEALSPDVAKRIFKARNISFAPQSGAA